MHVNILRGFTFRAQPVLHINALHISEHVYRIENATSMRFQLFIFFLR